MRIGCFLKNTDGFADKADCGKNLAMEGTDYGNPIDAVKMAIQLETILELFNNSLSIFLILKSATVQPRTCTFI